MILPYNWKEKLKLSNLRETMNQNSTAISVVAVVLSIVSLWVLFKSTQPPSFEIPTKAYYIDTETGEVSVQSLKEIPPLNNAAGQPKLVRALFYTCDDCKNRKLAWVEKYTPEAKKAMEKAQQSPESNDASLETITQQGHLVRGPNKGDKWVLADSEEGQKVVSSINCPKPEDVRWCNPD